MLINPEIVDGQIHGGVAQGIGGALFERLYYDENGQLLTSTLLDYLMPTGPELPDVRITHIETPSPVTMLGFKGAGEAGADGSPAAVHNAVVTCPPHDTLWLSIRSLACCPSVAGAAGNRYT